MPRPGRLTTFAARALALALASAPAFASEAPAAAREWAFSVAGNGYLLPGEDDLYLGVATADRRSLHLETRYNYEARNTWSFWGGWTWSTGAGVEFEITSMLGAVTGGTDGIAPGFETSLAWKRLDVYSEAEYIFDAHDRANDFTYAWSEVAVKPVDWLRVGVVGQRTRLVEDGLDVQRGFLAQAFVGRWTLGVDWFNPWGDEAFTVIVAAVDF